MYTIWDGDQPSDLVEQALSRFEAQLPDVLQALRDGRIPRPGSPGRALFAALLALQFVRTPDRMELQTLPLDALKASQGQVPVPRDAITLLLEERYGYRPAEREIKGTSDFVNMSLKPGMQANRAQMLEALFQAVPEVSQYLETKKWSVEVSKGQAFVTSDQPLSLWVRQPEPGRGLGLSEAEEIRFPIGPRHLLVLRNRGPEGRSPVRNARVAVVNEHTAATCRHMILSRPDDHRLIENLPLHARRPMFKQSGGPAYTKTEAGDEYFGEVVHLYRPYDDRTTGQSS